MFYMDYCDPISLQSWLACMVVGSLATIRFGWPWHPSNCCVVTEVACADKIRTDLRKQRYTTETHVEEQALFRQNQIQTLS